MVAKEIAILVIGTFIPLLINALFQMQYFTVYPEFTASINTKNINDTSHRETLLVSNVGRVQAKNAQVFVYTEDKLSLDRKVCVEGSFPSRESGDGIFEIGFQKMSVNVQCQVDFISPKASSINRVTIVADGSPGYDLYGLTPSGSGNVTSTRFVTIGEIFKFTTEFTTLLIVFESVAVGIVIYSVKRRRDIRKKRAATQKENVAKEIDGLKGELNFYIRSTVNETTIPAHVKERILFLREQIQEKERELDEISSKLKLQEKVVIRGNLNESLGSFFLKWAVLEGRLNQLMEKRGDTNYVRKMPASNLIRSLHQNGLVTADFLERFEVLRRYRNQIAHGEIKIEKEELEEKIQSVDELIDMLNNKEPNDKSENERQ